MDSWDTANLVLGCFCIVLSFLPTGYLISNNRYKRKLYLYSLLICVANIGMALGGLPEYLMDAVVEAGERRVLLLGGTLNIPPQTGQQNGGNRSRVTVEMSPGVRLQVQAVE